MQSAEKFMFEVSFDVEAEIPVEIDIPQETVVAEEEQAALAPTFSEEDIEIARQQGFEAGKQEGLTTNAESLNSQINETLVQIDQKLTAAFQTQDALNEVLGRSALSVAKGICRKMLPALSQQHSFDEVDRVVTEVFVKLVEEPRVTIHIHPTLSEDLEVRVKELSASKGYQGKIILQADETMQPSDCKVEWSNGGSERNSQSIWDEITAIVERNLGDGDVLWNEPDETSQSTQPAPNVEPEAAVEPEQSEQQASPENEPSEETPKTSIDD